MGDIWAETLARNTLIRAAGHSLHLILECQWDALLKRDPAVAQLVAALDIPNPLCPRLGLAGGRTGAVRLYYILKKGERMNYFDIKVSTTITEVR